MNDTVINAESMKKLSAASGESSKRNELQTALGQIKATAESGQTQTDILDVRYSETVVELVVKGFFVTTIASSGVVRVRW